MSDRTIRMPVRLTCVSPESAAEVVAELHRCKAPATRRGTVVTLPGDQPGFLIATVDWAVEQGLAEDDEGARCIAAMSDGIDRSRIGADHG